MTGFVATQTFRLRGIAVGRGQLLPGMWTRDAALMKRIIAKGLAEYMTIGDPLVAAPAATVSPPPAPVKWPDPDISEAHGVAVVALSCYPDIFARLRDGMNYWEPKVRKIVVTSGTAKFDAPGWEVLPGIEPFCFGRNANVGIRAAGLNDILLLNDDVRLSGPIIRALKETAHRHEHVGILAPQVNGGCGNTTQKVGARIDGDVAYPTQRLAFIAIYIKHSTIARVGLFDERFTGYGCEDTDFCYRVERAGLKSAVTPNATVMHGHGVASSSSFRRKMTPAQQTESMMRMRDMLEAKWRAML